MEAPHTSRRTQEEVLRFLSFRHQDAADPVCIQKYFPSSELVCQLRLTAKN